MILTGARIAAGVRRGEITIRPFAPENIEPNSYRVSLGSRLLDCATDAFDARSDPIMCTSHISVTGRVLEPGRLYLGETGEILGSDQCAATLYATRSLASMGMWIQFSAPLGHVGAVIRWTLEIRVAQRIVVFPGMTIGKIAFWDTLGELILYRGRYCRSTTVRRSALSDDRMFGQGGHGDPDRSADHVRGAKWANHDSPVPA